MVWVNLKIRKKVLYIVVNIKMEKLKGEEN